MRVRCSPRPTQVAGGRFLVSKPAGMLVFGTGTGKTLVQLLVGFRHLTDKRADKYFYIGTKSSLIEIQTDFLKFTDTQPMVVETMEQMEDFVDSSCPVCVMQWNWVERMLFLPRDRESERILSVLKKKKEEKKVWTQEENKWEMMYREQRKKEIQINKHRLAGVLSKVRTGWNLDEFHTIKTPDSSVREAFDFIRPYMSFVYGYTATAVMRDVYDLYYLVNYLDPSILGSVENFEAKFVDRERKYRGRKLGWVIKGFRNLEMLNKLLEPVMMTYFKKMDINWKKTSVMLPAESEEAYWEAARGVFRKDPADAMKGIKQHSTRLNDLQYVVNNTWAKQKAFLIHLRDKLPQGALIFCAFYETHDMLQKLLDRYKVQHRSITGKNSSDERQEAKEWFNCDPTNKVLLITRAGGQSLNLQATQNLILYDTPFGIGYFIQIIGRVVREFSKHEKFDITFIILGGTIDEYKFELVTSQRELFVKVFNNEALPSSPEFDSFNSKVLARLRKELLWKTRKKGDLVQ